MKRFLNADSYGSTGQGFLGFNMFAYCGNNPISRVDNTGKDWDDWLKVGLGLVIVGVGLMLIAPTGGGSLALAAAGVEVATAVTVGEAAVITGSGMVAAGTVGHAMSSNPQYQGGSSYVQSGDGSLIDKDGSTWYTAREVMTNAQESADTGGERNLSRYAPGNKLSANL